ncbi:AAA family ATPase [Psychromonas sp. MME2]|uniref:AAA family ATPase n=1 Tax=Psychromonas sp. MME2 TaxID=3231033 RepID=UPI00339C8D54
MTEENVISINSNANSLRESINTLINSSSYTQAQISRETSIGKTRLSQFLSNSYTGDNAPIISTLSQWLELHTNKQSVMPSAPDFVKTTTAKQVISTLRYAQASRGDGMSVVMGAPGVGKSAAAKYYADNAPNCWLVVASPSLSSLVGFFYELAMELGIDNPPRRANSLCHVIRHRLEGTNGLIVIDEADHLQLEVIEELRVMQQKVGVGLALVGNPTVYGKMVGDSRKVDLSRLESRIAKRLSIPKVKQSDITSIATAWGLTSDVELDLINNIAGKRGQLRKLSHTLRLASMIAQGSNQRMNESHIRSAFNDLKQEGADHV